jgi:RNA polymerase Rpb2, domain 2
MMEKFRPSLEEADVIQTRNLALDYIGKRGNATNVGRNERMAYAKNLLKVEVCVLYVLLQCHLPAPLVFVFCMS